MPRAFFFPHSMEGTRLPLSRRPKFPSRVALPVEGTEVTSAGTSTSRGFVVADGFWFQGHPPAAGSNQDPCVFSTPLGPLHAFCRVERAKGSDNYVVRLGGCAGHLLPDEVKQDDLIFYGKPHVRGPSLRIAIDTVIVVDHVAPIRSLLRSVSSDDDAFRFSLLDALPDGTHNYAGKHDTAAIVGRVSPRWSNVVALATSFVPMAQVNGDGHRVPAAVGAGDVGTLVATRLAETFRDRMFAGAGPIANKGRIVEIEWTDAERICATILVWTSGRVFVPPLRPAGNLLRYDLRTGELVSWEAYAERYGTRPSGW